MQRGRLALAASPIRNGRLCLLSTHCARCAHPYSEVVARSKSIIWTAFGLAVAAAVVTLPIWGMGPAVFMDSDRTILSHTLSPDRRHVAQIERLVVGGVPSIVVTVRRAWMPNWYLLECVAASHYEETSARLRWHSNGSLIIATPTEARFWRTDGAPFHPTGCSDFSVSVVQAAPQS